MIIFSDIDGTLLDFETSSPARAQPGIDLLKQRGIPLVLVSSKTFAEMEKLAKELLLDAPFAFENGAGIAVPAEQGGEGFSIELAGRGIDELRAFLPPIEKFLGMKVSTILDMTPVELSDYAGLTPEEALLARERRASLPFIAGHAKKIPPADAAALEKFLEKEGLTAAWGGKFHQLRDRGASKENAVVKITRLLMAGKKKTPVTVGIGDSENDFGMLGAVDRAYLVRNRFSGIDYSRVEFRVTRGYGPAGFSEAVRDACGG